MKSPKSLVGGCLLILASVASGLMLLFIFAMSTLSGGEFPDGTAEWLSVVLGTIIRSPDTITYTCIAALAFGFYLSVRPSGIRMTVRRMMIWVAVIAVVLGILVRAASKENWVWVAAEMRPDGTVVYTVQYANFFGPTRKVEHVRK